MPRIEMQVRQVTEPVLDTVIEYVLFIDDREVGRFASRTAAEYTAKREIA